MEEKKRDAMLSKIGLYACVPLEILKDKRLGLNDLKVYVALMAYQGKKESCYPSHGKIANRACINERAVKNAISNLIKYKWLEKKKRFEMSNIYKCLINKDIPERNISKRVIRCNIINANRGKANDGL